MIKPIPGYLAYLITEIGEIYSRTSGERVHPEVSNGSTLRPAVRLYINGHRTKRQYVDKLVFMTFKPKEFIPNGYCKHLDGDVMNNHIDNLTMVDYDPYSKSLSCKIYGENVISNETIEFESHDELAKFLNMTKNSARAITKTPKLRKDGWIFKRG